MGQVDQTCVLLSPLGPTQASGGRWDQRSGDAGALVMTLLPCPGRRID